MNAPPQPFKVQKMKIYTQSIFNTYPYFWNLWWKLILELCFWLALMNFGKSIIFLLWTDFAMTSCLDFNFLNFWLRHFTVAKSNQWENSCSIWSWSGKIWTNHRALVLATTESLRLLTSQLQTKLKSWYYNSVET